MFDDKHNENETKYLEEYSGNETFMRIVFCWLEMDNKGWIVDDSFFIRSWTKCVWSG